MTYPVWLIEERQFSLVSNYRTILHGTGAKPRKQSLPVTEC